MEVQLIFYKQYYLNAVKISYITISDSSVNSTKTLNITMLDQSNITYANVSEAFTSSYASSVNNAINLIDSSTIQDLSFYSNTYFQAENIVYIFKDIAVNGTNTLTVRFNDQSEWLLSNLSDDDVLDFFDSASFNVTII